MVENDKYQFPTKRNCSYYIYVGAFLFGMVLWAVLFPFRWIMSRVRKDPVITSSELVYSGCCGDKCWDWRHE
jgi:hypothetical protein